MVPLDPKPNKLNPSYKPELNSSFSENLSDTSDHDVVDALDEIDNYLDQKHIKKVNK